MLVAADEGVLSFLDHMSLLAKPKQNASILPVQGQITVGAHEQRLHFLFQLQQVCSVLETIALGPAKT